MEKKFLFPKKKLGSPPGSLIHIGEVLSEKILVQYLAYNASDGKDIIIEKKLPEFSAIPKEKNIWIDIVGVHDREIIENIGRTFHINSLVLEDIMNTTQRIKCDEYDNMIFFVIRDIFFEKGIKKVLSQQVSLILGENFVISLRERESPDLFSEIRKRLSNKDSKVRKSSSDFLFYSLLDTIVDKYYEVLEKFEEMIESHEEGLMENPDIKVLQSLYLLKQESLFLKRWLAPLRRAVNLLEKVENHLIKKETIPYLRDIYDHVFQLYDTLETIRDFLSSMLDLYLSSLSNKLNVVMKTLTLVSTIFIPLTFIAGLYGMNFKFMPELDNPVAYPIVIFVMVCVTAGMIAYFKRNKWL